MNSLAALALTVLLAGGSVLVVRDEPARDPWWRRATIQPRSQVVHGVPVKRLHPDWCAAEAFSRDFFGADRLVGPTDGLAFALEGRFDGGDRPQLAFVGAYRRCGGEQGLFLAIVEPAAQRPRVRFLVEVPEAPSAIAHLTREPDGTLVVWWCVDCAEGVRVPYNREAKGFHVAGPATPR
ncbi:MAG TPA: hypothetical protein VFQ20_04020 [Burkholderiaceae bacterium]|nr:hypothetical protein [Burkholderiaceae bacterium]